MTRVSHTHLGSILIAIFALMHFHLLLWRVENDSKTPLWIRSYLCAFADKKGCVDERVLVKRVPKPSVEYHGMIFFAKDSFHSIVD